MNRLVLAPHDLLRFTYRGTGAALPAWGPRDGEMAWAVVRRARALAPGHVAVGLRGPERADRFALAIREDDVLEVLSPEKLVARAFERADIPDVTAAYEALRDPVESPLREYPWGPTGSVGYELATGTAAARPGSDLDIVVRALRSITRPEAARLRRQLATLPGRIDCLLETRVGAVALVEWADHDQLQVLLRTVTGPVLTADPWGSTTKGAAP